MKLDTAAMIDELVTRLNLATADETQILFWFQEAQDWVERKRQDWAFCIDYDKSGTANEITTVADQFAYDLPTNFDHFLSVFYKTHDKILRPKSLSWLRQKDPDLSASGRPDWYIPLGPTGTSALHAVGFYVPPDTSSETIGHDYYKKLPALANTSSSYSLVPDHSLLMAIVERRGRLHGEETEDTSVINELKQEIVDRMQTLIRHNTFNWDEDPGMKQSIHTVTSEW